MAQKISISGYKILKEILPSGGWANVYVAEYKRRKVALKVLKEKYYKDKSKVKGFFKEAEILSKFNNPNIVNIIDVGSPSLKPIYYSMEYYSRGSLEKYLRKKKLLTTSAIIDISLQICRALDTLNREGYLHLDLKPSNILFAENNRVVVTDFGSVRNILYSELQNDRTGTPQFMSPEQFDVNRELTFASDLYSLGIVMYNMASGDPPFKGNDFQQMELYHTQIAPFKLSELKLDQKVDNKLEIIINKLLSKKPEDRYQTALSLTEDLKKILKSRMSSKFKLKIDLLNKDDSVIKSKVYSKFPVMVGSQSDSKNNFYLEGNNGTQYYGFINSTGIGNCILIDKSKTGTMLNGHKIKNETIPLKGEINYWNIDSNRLKLIRIPVSDFTKSIKYFSLIIVVILLVSGIYIITNLLNKYDVSIYNLALTPSVVQPGEWFNFSFESIMDPADDIKEIIVAPFGKEMGREEKLSENKYRYNYGDLTEGKENFNFAVKILTNSGATSNWIESTISINYGSEQLILSNLTVPSPITVGNTVSYEFNRSFSLPEDSILLERTIEKDGNVLFHSTDPLLEVQNELTFTEIGSMSVRLRAFDLANKTFSNVLERQVRVTGNIPDPTIRITGENNTKSQLRLSYVIRDSVYDGSELSVQLFVNNIFVEAKIAKGAVKYTLPAISNYSYFLRVKSPDRRRGRSQLKQYSNLPDLEVIFTTPPIVRANGEIRFAYTIEDESFTKDEDYEIILVLNPGLKTIIPSGMGLDYTTEALDSGSYKLQLKIRSFNDGRTDRSEEYSVTVN